MTRENFIKNINSRTEHALGYVHCCQLLCAYRIRVYKENDFYSN